MKKAIVLGVGNAQVDLISYLKETGWWVIGCSYRHEGRGLQYIDQFALLNVTDTVGIEQLARKEKAELVYSIGSDLAMPTIARVASRLGLPTYISAETADVLQNKNLLRSFLFRHEISPVRYKKIRGVEDLSDWTIYPAIIKPVDNQGQRGVFLANCREEASLRLEASIQFSRSKTLIIEEFLEGPEVSVNTFVVNGETIFIEVSDRLVLEGYNGGIPRGHIYPVVQCSDTVLIGLMNLTAACNQKLGIENGPVYFQVILTAEGPRIVEVTPRLDGCHMWRLLKTVRGVDLLESSIKCLLGDTLPDMRIKVDLQRHYLGFFYSDPYAVFCMNDHVLANETAHLEYYYADGEIVRPINGYMEKVGYYIERYVQ